MAVSSSNGTEPSQVNYWISQNAFLAAVICFWYGSYYWVRSVVISIGLKVELIILSISVGVVLRSLLMYIISVIYKMGLRGVLIANIIPVIIRYFCMFGIIKYYGWESYVGVKKD